MSDQYEIQQTYIQRAQSPEIEHLMGKAIHDELKVLLSEGYLYQTRSIDLSEIVGKADEHFSGEALKDEFTHRPWIAYSKNRGFTRSEQQFTNLKPSDPLEGPFAGDAPYVCDSHDRNLVRQMQRQGIIRLDSTSSTRPVPH